MVPRSYGVWKFWQKYNEIYLWYSLGLSVDIPPILLTNWVTSSPNSTLPAAVVLVVGGRAPTHVVFSTFRAFSALQHLLGNPGCQDVPRVSGGFLADRHPNRSQQLTISAPAMEFIPNPGDVSRLGIQAKLPSFRHPKVKSGLKTKSFHRWLNTTDGSHAKHGHSKIRSLNPSVLMATA